MRHTPQGIFLYLGTEISGRTIRFVPPFVFMSKPQYENLFWCLVTHNPCKFSIPFDILKTKYRFCFMKRGTAYLAAVGDLIQKSSNISGWFRYWSGPGDQPVLQYPCRPDKKRWQTNGVDCEETLWIALLRQIYIAVSFPPRFDSDAYFYRHQ